MRPPILTNSRVAYIAGNRRCRANSTIKCRLATFTALAPTISVRLLARAASGHATAAPPTQPTTVNPLQIKVVRVKPIDPMSPKLRFQLSDSSVDLMKAFSLGGFEGVGGAWKMPPMDEIFDARFGQW